MLENPRCSAEVQHQVHWWINVWCGMYKNRLIGPVFYEGKLTRFRYLELLEDAICDFVDVLLLSDLRNLWLQHNDAPLHQLSSVQ